MCYINYPNSRIRMYNPENRPGLLREYLETARQASGGCIDEREVGMRSFYIAKRGYQTPGELPVHGEVIWGRIRSLSKNIFT